MDNSLLQLQDLYRRLDGAKMCAMRIGEPNLAIIIDKLMDVVYERAKGLVDLNDSEVVTAQGTEEIGSWEDEGGQAR